MERSRLRAGLGAFVILMGSYAYFWHSRDWNTASRLMLTYSIVDQGRLSIDGLENQTGDRARYQGHYYSDKLPGYPFLAVVPDLVCRQVFGMPPHPLGGPALAHWPTDYWVTLATSGLLTALSALVLMGLARDLGCSERRAALVGLAYGLATPAFVYATLAYGHQATAFALLTSFALIARPSAGRESLRAFSAGFLAAFAAVIELQVGPVAAILGFYLIGQCLARSRKFDAIVFFGLGALIPTLALLLYNVMAFGGPLDMGYFHHATAQFARVHGRDNPLGLRSPDWGLVVPLLWGRYRGLLFYAPIVALAVPGWVELARRRKFGMAVVSLLAAVTVFGVNLSYPEWTGGWSTGPRLLVPLLPFAMIPVAALLGVGGRAGRWIGGLAVVLTLAGAVLMLLFQGVGARLPQDVADPLVEIVLPLWSGRAELPGWWTGERFARNPASLLAGGWLESLPAAWRWIQFLPLIVFQAVGGAWLMVRRGDRREEPGTLKPEC